MTLSRILFIAEGQLGDLLVLTPAIAATKKSFPQAHITVLIFQRRSYFRGSGSAYFNEDATGGAAEVFRSNSDVDTVMEVNLQALRELGWYSRVKAEIDIMIRLRRKRFDAVIVFPRDRFVLWAYISGASVRVGQKRQVYHQTLTHTRDIHKRTAGVLRYYCSLVEAIGVTVDSYDTRFIIPPAFLKEADEFLQNHGARPEKRLVAIHPGASAPDRVWPPERYAMLIDALQRDGVAEVVLCGGPFDKKVVNSIQSLAKTPVILSDGDRTIGQLAALLSRCALFVGSNSGPRHLAAAVHTKTLALLAHNDQFEWEVYEDRTQHRIIQGDGMCPVCPESACLSRVPEGELYGSQCLRMIHVEDVLAHAREMLSSARQ